MAPLFEVPPPEEYRNHHFRIRGWKNKDKNRHKATFTEFMELIYPKNKLTTAELKVEVDDRQRVAFVCNDSFYYCRPRSRYDFNRSWADAKSNR